MIAVRVLGPLEVMVGGARADVGGPRQRCVLARLIAGGGQVVSVDRLIEDLYTGEAPPRAIAALQAYVSRLRSALEPGRLPRACAETLITSPPGYALRLDRGEVDAWRFEESMHKATGKAAAAVYEELTAALALWRGPAFHEFAGLAWADLEASRLDELRLAAVERAADAALELGRAAQVATDMDRLTAEHPLREEMWRLLALALYRCGRQGDALAALRHARARLADDLGVDPGPALRQLEDDILAQAPSLLNARPLPAPARPLTGPQATTLTAGRASLVGREAELAQLARSAADAAVGRMRIALVSGEAGSGKTALAGQVRERLVADGWASAVGRCPEHEGAPAGWPWTEVLGQLAAIGQPANPEPLAPLLGETGPAAGDVDAARFLMHRAIARYLADICEGAPLLLILDDLHRADTETLAIVADTAATLSGCKILLLATYREAEAGEPLADCLAALARHEPDRISLRGLSVAAAGELIRTICERPVDEETAQVIAERTGGNPFFIRETARLLDSEGPLVALSEVPAGVHEVLRRRIHRLPATAQTILQQGAVIGRELTVNVLMDVTSADEQVVMDAIESGLHGGLVTEPAPGRIRFAHALVCDTLASGLSRLRRTRLHERIGEAIERHRPGDVAALAHHFVQAGTDPAKAVRYCRLAAEHAEERFAFQEAAQMWERAIACMDRGREMDARERIELVLSLVRALAHSGQLVRARGYRQEAVRSASSLSDPLLLARVITSFHVPGLWRITEYGRFDDELVQTAERALELLPAGEDHLRCRLLAGLALELEGAETDRGYQASIQAVELARRISDPEVMTIALTCRYAQTLRYPELDSEPLRLGAEMLAMDGKPVTTDAIAHLLLMQANCARADFDAADLHTAEAERIIGAYNLPALATRASFYRALRTALSGDVARAELSYTEAAEQMSRLGMWQHAVALRSLGMFCIRATLGQLADSAGEFGELHQYRRPLSAAVAELYAVTLAASGRLAEACEVAQRPNPILRDPFRLFLTGVRGMLGVLIDDRERAEAAYETLLPHAARPLGAQSGMISLWPAGQVLGDLAHYLGCDDPRVHYQQALATAEKAGVQPWIHAAEEALHRVG